MGNQIEEIQKLYAKVKTYKIPKEPKEGEEQISLEITPLSLEDIGLLSMKEELSSEETAKNVQVLVSKSLGVEKDAVKKISFGFLKDLMSAIGDVNNFQEEDMKKTGIKDFIKQKQDQIKSKAEDEKSNRKS